MTLNHTPFSFLFIALYILILSVLSSITDFVLFWLLIEIITLLFIGISYSSVTNSVSPLIVFFLAQSVSSFLILFSFLITSNTIIFVGLVLNMAMFPLFNWFVYSVSLFSTSLFTLSCTLNNLPVLIIITTFNLNFSDNAFWLVLSLNVLFSGAFMVLCTNMRSLLVMSSVANNSWFVLGQFTSFIALIVFFAVYSLTLLIVINLSTLSSFSPSVNTTIPLLSFIAILSGLPPFPMFFANIHLLISTLPTSQILLFLVCNSLLVCSYILYTMKHVIWSSSNAH